MLTHSVQKFVGQIAMIPNLKIDYVVLNAGVLRYPNVISPTAMHNQTPTLTLAESHRAVRPPLSRRTFLVSV
jgi:hypothetical protein